MESDAATPPSKRRRRSPSPAAVQTAEAAVQTAAEALAAGPVVDEPDDEAERLLAKRAREELMAKRAGYRVFHPRELVGAVPEWMFTKEALEALTGAGPETAPDPGSQAACGSQAVDAGYVLLGRSGEELDLAARGQDDRGGG